MGLKKFTKNNSVNLVLNGPEFIEVNLALIAKAKYRIMLHTYIFEEDEVTRPLIDALIAKAREGVHVFFLIDALGSPEISSSLKAEFIEVGLHFEYFSRVLSWSANHIGRRLHQKALIIDNHTALCGGINTAKKFIDPHDDNPWLDFSLIIEGEEVERLHRKVARIYLKHFPNLKKVIRSRYAFPHASHKGTFEARTLVNDFMRFKNEIYRSYLVALRNSKKSIRLTAPYFLPGKNFLKELKKASKRGVKIELIFGQRSDHKMERWSSKYLYHWYLKNGIHVFEWKDSILHAKAAIIDENWVSIGSYNHNYISRYACLELNVEIQNTDFAKEVTEKFEQIKQRSEEISEQRWGEHLNLLRSGLYLFMYLLSKLVTFISLIFISKKKEIS